MDIVGHWHERVSSEEFHRIITVIFSLFGLYILGYFGRRYFSPEGQKLANELDRAFLQLYWFSFFIFLCSISLLNTEYYALGFNFLTYGVLMLLIYYMIMFRHFLFRS